MLLLDDVFIFSVLHSENPVSCLNSSRLWRVPFLVDLAQFRITWGGRLHGGLFRSGWLVGVSVLSVFLTRDVTSYFEFLLPLRPYSDEL